MINSNFWAIIHFLIIIRFFNCFIILATDGMSGGMIVECPVGWWWNVRWAEGERRHQWTMLLAIPSTSRLILDVILWRVQSRDQPWVVPWVPGRKWRSRRTDRFLCPMLSTGKETTLLKIIHGMRSLDSSIQLWSSYFFGVSRIHTMTLTANARLFL